jgi:phage tail-like protein
MKRKEIEQLLPVVFQRTIHPGSPLLTLLEVMEALHVPSEEILAHLEDYLNPYRAPDRLVPFLAYWVDLGRLLQYAPGTFAPTSPSAFPSGLGRLRDLVMQAAYLSKWRGTARGLLHFLEVATGMVGFSIDEQVPGADGRPLPFHMQVQAPAAAESYRALVEAIVEMEKPAYVTYELVFSPPV